MAAIGPGVSGLEMVPDANVLHQPHQEKLMDSPGDRYTRVFEFSSPEFDKGNQIKLTALPMVIEDMWIEFDVTKSATAATAIYLPPPASWVGPNGVVLYKEGMEVYRATEAELRMCDKFLTTNAQEQLRFNEASDETDNTTLNTMWNLTGSGSINRKVKMHLRPIAEKIMSHMGSLGAYASNHWMLDVGLLGITRIAAGSATATDTVFTINGMRIYITGHREDSQNQSRISRALAADGVKISFDAPFHTSFILPASDSLNTVQTLKFPSVEGILTSVWIVPRRAAGLSTTTTANVNRSGWIAYEDLRGITLGVGTQGMPTAFYGKYIEYNELKQLAQGHGYSGSSYIINRGTDADAMPTLPRSNTNAMVLPFAEKMDMSQRFGSWSGGIRVNNDFQIQFVYPALSITEAKGDIHLDVLVWVRRTAILAHNKVSIVNDM